MHIASVILNLRGVSMFLFKKTKNLVKRIGMNMAVYGYCGGFVLMPLALYVPKVIAYYICCLTAVFSFVAIIGSVISVVCFFIEIFTYNPTKYEQQKNIIYSYGIKQPGSLFESVELKLEEGAYYYITYSGTDRWHGAGEKLPVPEKFIKNNNVDIDNLLVYIANEHSYMESMKKYRTSTIQSFQETSIVQQTVELMIAFLESQNYDIEIETNKLTIVKHNDDQWNHFN